MRKLRGVSFDGIGSRLIPRELNKCIRYTYVERKNKKEKDERTIYVAAAAIGKNIVFAKASIVYV